MGTPFPAQEIANRMLTGFARVGNNQITGRMLDYNDDQRHTPKAACALGALSLGLDKHQRLADYKQDMDFIFDEAFTSIYAKHPVTGDSSNIEDVIVCLNDDHGWSVPAIAKWISCLPAEGEPCC